jgi:acetyl esterase/lipase
VAIAEWVGANAMPDFGTETIVISGISAGVHLAAATLLRLRDEGSATFDKIVAARLDSGPYDLGLTPSAPLADENTLVLTHAWPVGLWRSGSPGTPQAIAERPDSLPY